MLISKSIIRGHRNDSISLPIGAIFAFHLFGGGKYESVILILILLILSLLDFIILANADATQQFQDLNAEYHELMYYQQFILPNTSSETIYGEYTNRVEAYNTAYEHYIHNSKSYLVGFLYESLEIGQIFLN